MKAISISNEMAETNQRVNANVLQRNKGMSTSSG